jgi:hypothetical protein
MEQTDIGKLVELHIKRLDGRVFVQTGKIVSYNDTHFRIKTALQEEEILKTDVQRVVFKS